MDWFPFDVHGFDGVCIRHTGLENLHHGDRSPGNSSRFWLVVSKEQSVRRGRRQRRRSTFEFKEK